MLLRVPPSECTVPLTAIQWSETAARSALCRIHATVTPRLGMCSSRSSSRRGSPPIAPSPVRSTANEKQPPAVLTGL